MREVLSLLKIDRGLILLVSVEALKQLEDFSDLDLISGSVVVLGIIWKVFVYLSVSPNKMTVSVPRLISKTTFSWWLSVTNLNALVNSTLVLQDSGSSNSQYALLSVPKQRPVIKAESLKISFSETLSEEQAHLIDTDQPILNVITCKSRSEKNELAKACNFILPVKETPSKGGSMLNDGSVDQPKNHS